MSLKGNLGSVRKHFVVHTKMWGATLTYLGVVTEIYETFYVSAHRPTPPKEKQNKNSLTQHINSP